jgi:hypothetical protein
VPAVRDRDVQRILKPERAGTPATTPYTPPDRRVDHYRQLDGTVRMNAIFRYVIATT